MHVFDMCLVVYGELVEAGDGCNRWHIIVDRFSLDSTHNPRIDEHDFTNKMCERKR